MAFSRLHHSLPSFIRFIVITGILFYSSLFLHADQIKIRFIVTNDVHATVFAHDFMRDEPHNGSLSRVKSFVDMERAKLGQNVILLDNGDILQGQPTGYFANYLDTAEFHLFSRILNLMEFDAASVGNHDIETGPDVYNRITKELNFPWLAANVVDCYSGQPYFQPYTVIEVEGVRIAILGLTPPSIPIWLPQKLWEGLEFVDLMEASNYWIDHIQKNEAPDAIIGLFHSGAGELWTPDDYPDHTDNACRYIAKYVPGFDVIFTAHDHQPYHELIENITGQQVLMLGGQPYGLKVAVADLLFEGGSTERIHRKNMTGSLVEMSGYAPSSTFDSIFQPDFEKVFEYVYDEIGLLEVELRSRASFFGSAAFTDFIHQMQLNLTGADISFAAPLSFDVVIPAGKLTMQDMFNLYRFENYLYMMELSGSEIKDYLEYSYNLWIRTMNGPTDNMLLLNHIETDDSNGFKEDRLRTKNPFYNFDSALGLIYEVDLTAEFGHRIRIISMQDGAPFIYQNNYKVALNSYRGSGGGDHLTKGAGIAHEELKDRIIYVSEKDLRSHIADYIISAGNINPKASNNWKFVPEAWAKEAARRDYKLLFGSDIQ